MKRVAIIAIGIVLVCVLGFGAYTQLYVPSGQPILSGPKPIPANNQEMMPVTPLAELPAPDAARVADTLRGAAEAVLPGYRIDEEQMFTHPGGWDAPRKLSGEYLGDEFGLRQQVEAQKQLGDRSFRYLVWGAGWPRSMLDDRKVLALEYFEPLKPDYTESMLGYFVMKPQ